MKVTFATIDTLDQQLLLDNLSDIYDLCPNNISTKWLSLGVALDILPETLHCIHQNVTANQETRLQLTTQCMAQSKNLYPSTTNFTAIFYCTCLRIWRK